MYRVEVQKLDQVRCAALEVLDKLLGERHHHLVGLPIDDLRIAVRFMELASESLARVTRPPNDC